MTWNAPWPVAPKPVPRDPRLAALQDAVDKFLAGASARDDLQRALWDSWRAR